MRSTLLAVLAPAVGHRSASIIRYAKLVTVRLVFAMLASPEPAVRFSRPAHARQPNGTDAIPSQLDRPPRKQTCELAVEYVATLLEASALRHAETAGATSGAADGGFDHYILLYATLGTLHDAIQQ